MAWLQQQPTRERPDTFRQLLRRHDTNLALTGQTIHFFGRRERATARRKLTGLRPVARPERDAPGDRKTPRTVLLPTPDRRADRVGLQSRRRINVKVPGQQETGFPAGGHRMNSSVAAVRADYRERNAAFPSLRPAPPDPCTSRPGCLRTTRGRHRGYSSAPGSRVRRRRGSCGYSHARRVSARDAPSFASWSLR